MPQTLSEALEIRRACGALPIAGGTDVMVQLNFDLDRPRTIIDVSRPEDLKRWEHEDGHVFLGAGVTFARIMQEMREFIPLVQASRTVGSPQIRNRGTVGGNLGTASPAGDALPVLAAYEASVILGRTGGTRSLPWDAFLLGVKRNALATDELILGTRWKVVRGLGSFSKVGTRNAMVISIVGLCLQIDEDARAFRVAMGSVAPRIVRAREAEAFAAGALEDADGWNDPTATLTDSAFKEFGERAAAAARPIDDVRGTAAYRRHACAVLAQRALRAALRQRQTRAEL